MKARNAIQDLHSNGLNPITWAIATASQELESDLEVWIKPNYFNVECSLNQELNH